jgi:phenylpropionate dioxygenase-like ring-hydroxylating dioxygenase large terminal subunit
MWIPIALSRDVPDGSTRAVILDSRELVIWRGDSGSAQVWEDRCPHRGMRLSFGFVRGDSLNCLYHGWQYGAQASCQRIPAHPDLEVPNTIKANAFASAELSGLILVNFVPAGAPPALPTARPIASLAVSASSETILSLCAAAPRGDIQMFAADLDGIAFQIGWHEVTRDKTMLHAASVGESNATNALVVLHALRDQAERRAA